MKRWLTEPVTVPRWWYLLALLVSFCAFASWLIERFAL